MSLPVREYTELRACYFILCAPPNSERKTETQVKIRIYIYRPLKQGVVFSKERQTDWKDVCCERESINEQR